MRPSFPSPADPHISPKGMTRFSLVLFMTVSLPPADGVTASDERDIVLRTSRTLDGRGAVLEDRDIVVRGSQIADVGSRNSASANREYDLTGLTVLPGYIDTHVHIGRHFDPNGKLHEPDDRDIAHQTLHAVENAYRTLMGGVTTVQSLGGEEDAQLKEWIARGVIPGPRVLSSLGAIRAETGSPMEIREFVREKKATGADVVKIFASTSIRLGGITNMTAEQLSAACGEAHALGLRSVVHAHRPDAIELAADAGCSQIEHAWLADRAALEVIAQRGMYLGNQIDLLFRNYAENGDRFDGVGGYTLEGLANLQEARSGALKVFQESLQVPGLKMVYNTDVNAGAHGRNAEEIVAYVEQGGQAPMEAVIAATSRAAESLGLSDRIGAIETGMEADIIALDGDPMADAEAFGRVVFVMRAGTVYRNQAGSGR
ncbi:MAG TPA: amidohydrolase family protein [Vicinamibacteria bacterium]|nr:amidohydrolase family protein [Vicinamibacteria bacterium]